MNIKLRVKVVPSLKLYVMKTHGEAEMKLHAFSTSALDVGEWSASCSGRFTPEEIPLGTYWIGG
jgi:hypothetical protein